MLIRLAVFVVVIGGAGPAGRRSEGDAPAVGPGRMACGGGLGPSGSGFAGRERSDLLLRPGGFVYLGTYPSNCRPGWTIDLQGVTHDSASWFFTQKTTLWRFPVGMDLRVLDPGPGEGAEATGLPDPLAREGYDHFGATAWYAGLVLIPVTGVHPAVVAVFRARDLAYLGHLQLPAQRGAAWLAVGSDGLLYSSDANLDGARGVLSYSPDWPRLMSGRLPRSPGATPEPERRWVRLLPAKSIPLLDEEGRAVWLHTIQGGVFASAKYFYTMNGYCEGTTRESGIMAFAIEGDTGRRVARSTERPGPYEFEYHPGQRGLFWCREEPEGLTVWDLDDGRAPGVRGQLHALMIDNAIWDYGGLYFRHYRLRLEE